MAEVMSRTQLEAAMDKVAPIKKKIMEGHADSGTADETIVQQRLKADAAEITKICLENNVAYTVQLGHIKLLYIPRIGFATCW